MHLLEPRILGIALLVLWVAQWMVMKLAPGGFPRDKFEAGPIPLVYNILAMLIILVVMPVVAILLVTRALAPLEATRFGIEEGRPLALVEVLGIVVLVAGHLLVSWGRLALGTAFRPGGATPRSGDTLVVQGPYRLIRHPMYTALLCLVLGLTLLVQSLVLLALFAALLVMILLLIPIEERQLEDAYGDAYRDYRKTVKALVPLVY